MAFCSSPRGRGQFWSKLRIFSETVQGVAKGCDRFPGRTNRNFEPRLRVQHFTGPAPVKAKNGQIPGHGLKHCRAAAIPERGEYQGIRFGVESVNLIKGDPSDELYSRLQSHF